MLVLNFMLSLMTSFKPFLVWVTMILLLMQFVTNCLKIIGISMLRILMLQLCQMMIPVMILHLMMRCQNQRGEFGLIFQMLLMTMSVTRQNVVEPNPYPSPPVIASEGD